MAPYMMSSGTISETSTPSQSNEKKTWKYDSLSQTMPIAICGMSLRLPGGISTPSQFWDFLINKGDGRGPVPQSRYDASKHYSKSGKHGYIRTEHGYFLDDAVDLGALDTTFFSMPKNEIERADPQQRLLLEISRECLESAGETNYRGKSIGTYVGSFGEDWLTTYAKDNQVQGLYKVSGYGDFVLSNRISYELDLVGPSMTIRTGCSSALIGLHQACLSLRSGESDGAIVAGCNLLLAPGMSIDMSEQGVLSPNGSSKTFDADADGYARGEAVNAVYIKRLDDALRDGNPIRAIIRSTFSNADGKTAGLSTPSAESHEAMIRKAYAAAGLSDFSATGFVECHGTGTPAGDPIETQAVANVFGDHGVYIGSVKSNVGHSEGASGITSLIKSVLALENQIIPPNIKFNKPNPKIPFAERKLTVPIEPTPWPKDRVERVSVNSFGIGGANVHTVIDSTRSYMGAEPAHERTAQTSTPEEPRLVLFSANTTDSLRRQVVNNQRFIDEDPESLPDVAYTLGARREHLPQRSFSVICSGAEQNTAPFTKAPGSVPKVVFVFTGQGAQWPRMGAELLSSKLYPTFSRSIQLMDKALTTLPDGPSWTLAEELLKPAESSSLSKASISQPLCTAIQVALVDTLAEYSIFPYAVVGHSSGEIAAAYAAGKLSANEAIIAAYYRGVVSSDVQKPGAMAAIGMSWDDTSAFLTKGVVIACENSPSSVTISGDKDCLIQTLNAIKEKNPSVLARELKVDRAYHSHHMKEVGDKYGSLASRYVFGGHTKPNGAPIMFSSVTGKEIDGSDRTDSRYWQSNLESPVLFRTAVMNLVEHHNKVSKNSLMFLEVGPHSALAGPLRQTLAQASINSPYASCFTRSKNAIETLLTAIGQLWLHDVDIDFKKLLNSDGARQVVSDLPTYPWQHDSSYLFETRLFKESRWPRHRRHEILGMRVAESTDNEPLWRNILSLDNVPWIRDHNVKGDVIFPCAGYVGMAGEAARQLSDESFAGFSIRGMVIDSAMLLQESKTTEVITSLSRHRLTDSLESIWWDFVISSHNGSSWTKHCTGQVCARTKAEKCSPPNQNKGQARRVKPATWYQTLRNVGANYGPHFQGLKNITCSTTENKTEGTAIHTVQDDEEFYAVHPTKIDFFLQLFSVAAFRGIGHKAKKMIVPTFVEYMDVYECDSEVYLAIEASASARGAISGGGYGYGADGEIALSAKGIRLSPLSGDVTEENPDPHAGARIFWQRDIDFVKLSNTIQKNADQVAFAGDCRELTAICVRDSLSLINGIETTATHLVKFRNWMEKQPKPKTDATVKHLLMKLVKTDMECVVVAMKQVFDNIVSLYRGQAEPIEVLVQDGVLTNVYKSVNWSKRTAFFQSLAHSKPNMRILEVGAGTGGTTSVFLSNIMNGASSQLMYSDYTYTDVSAGFFGAAQERFKAYPNMHFQALDITKDPVEQGFEEHGYDLIIASNVLHATPSLVETLTNVRKLLSTEGRLYLEELHSETKMINYIMGILPGWWLGYEDGRPDEPYVSPARWDEDLKKAGFEGVSDYAYDCDTPDQLNAFLVARPAADAKTPKVANILHTSASLAQAELVQAQLQSIGYDVLLYNFDASLPSDENDILAVMDLASPFLENIDPERFSKFQKLMQMLSSSKAGIFWVTRPSQLACDDPRSAQIVGASRVIRGELGVDFALCEVKELDQASCAIVEKVFSKFLRRRHDGAFNPEWEYAIKDGEVFIPRIYPIDLGNELRYSGDDTQEDIAFRLEVGKHGRLNTLHWAPYDDGVLAANEVTVEPKAVGMNFRDILTANGVVEADSMGLENAGIVRRVGSAVTELRSGDRVIVMGGCGFSTTTNVLSDYCQKIPDRLNFVEAATMPVVYATVIYSLLEIGQMQKGQTLLIHSACGGVGIAAIQIAKMVGVEIYCTVSSEEKIQYLKQSLGVTRDRIFNSRNSSFLPDLMRATNNRGVDIVLNSLSGELLHTSWDCVAEFGRMIEIGKRDLLGHGKLALNTFLLNRSYQCVDLSHLADARPQKAKALLKSVIDLYEEGHIQPITPIKIFSAAEIQDCFLYMQKGTHIGKIVVDMEVGGEKSLVTSKAAKVYHFDQHASYLLVGGLGGLGRAVSNWMIESGARHLVYVSRTAGESAEDQSFFQEIQSQDCSITAVKGNVTILADIEKAIRAAPKPVKGVINMSMVLRDQSFANMTHAEWTEVAAPKVQGTWNLHEATLGLDLDFFVLFSSVSATFGQRGQANYAGANSFLDSFVQFRHSKNLPAASVNVGVMLDHGYVAENDLIRERLLSHGTYGIRVPELLDSLLAVMTAPQQSTAEAPFTTPSNLAIGVRSTTSLASPTNRVIFKGDRRMAIYYNQWDDAATSNAAATSNKLGAFIAEAMSDPSVLSAAKTVDFVSRQIAAQLLTLLLRPVEDEADIDILRSLQDIGLDSLVAIELRSWWKTTFQFDISVLEMLGMGSMQALGQRAVDGLKERFEEPTIGEAQGPQKVDARAILATKMP